MDNFEQTSDILLDSAIDEKLSLSFEERIESHEKARQLVNELQLIGSMQRAGPEQAS